MSTKAIRGIKNRSRTFFRNLFLALIGAVLLFQGCGGGERMDYAPPLESDLVSRSQADGLQKAYPKLIARAAAGEPVKVIVGLTSQFTPPGHLNAGAQAAQEAAIARDQDTILNSLAAADHSHVKKFQFIPYMALMVNQNALNGLIRHPLVSSVTEDIAVKANLAQSVPLIKGDIAWGNGYTGAGWTVAILDTGVDKTHPFLTGKVVSEACYSYDNAASGYATTCPDASQAQVGAGAGVNCNLAYAGCGHGTHVAGIAAGTNASFSGVAKGANVIAIQVFTYDTWSGGTTAFGSDIVAGLNRVYALRGSYFIASVNLSLGGGLYTTNCDTADGGAFKAAADALSSVNIATVVASGNDGSSTSISWPACVSSAISVGATTKADAIASYSNSASILKLLAPGSSINSSYPGGSYVAWNGTSMATPHVTGAWAVYRHANPGASVAQALSTFQNAGTPVLDARNGLSRPRINLIVNPAVMASPSPGSTLPGTTVTFAWNAAVGATLYQVWVGTAAGSFDLGAFPAAGTTALSTVATGLPGDG
ncbi:MAG: S8 family serine peptidase, partial [Nitrospinota bacterium]|nr:S8 family serine peptidase [Nitrospinota bacterium]